MTYALKPVAGNRLALCLLLALAANSGCTANSEQQSLVDALLSADAAHTRQEDSAAPCLGQVLQAEVINARDLGGQPLEGGRRLACGLMLRGGELGALSSSGCQSFGALGLRSVIDLREAAVQAAEPPPACVTELARHISAPLPKLLPDTPENYLALLQEQTAVRAVFAALADPAGLPAYLHCVIGRDRASFISALILLAAGASRQTVLEEFELSAAAGVAVKPECLSAVLDAIEQRGGIAAYLAECGVPAAELETVRATLTSP